MWRYVYKFLAFIVLLVLFYTALPAFSHTDMLSVNIHGQRLTLNMYRDGRVEGHMNRLVLIGGFAPTPYGTFYVLSATDSEYLHWIRLLVSPTGTSYVWTIYRHKEQAGYVVEKVFYNDISLFHKMYKQILSIIDRERTRFMFMGNYSYLVANTKGSGFPIDKGSVLKVGSKADMFIGGGSNVYTQTQYIPDVAYVRPLVNMKAGDAKVGFGLIFNEDALFNAIATLTLHGKEAILNDIDDIGVRHIHLSFAVYTDKDTSVTSAFVDNTSVYMSDDENFYNPPPTLIGNIHKAYVAFYQSPPEDKYTGYISVGRVLRKPVSTVYWQIEDTKAFLQTGALFFMPMVHAYVTDEKASLLGLPEYMPEDVYYLPIYATLREDVVRAYPRVEISGYVIVRVHAGVLCKADDKWHPLFVDVPIYVHQVISVVSGDD